MHNRCSHNLIAHQVKAVPQDLYIVLMQVRFLSLSENQFTKALPESWSNLIKVRPGSKLTLQCCVCQEMTHLSPWTAHEGRVARSLLCRRVIVPCMGLLICLCAMHVLHQDQLYEC